MAVAQQGLVYQDQEDFSAGGFPGLEVIPRNGAEDIVNGVLGEDGSVFRRGGAVYKQTASIGTTLRSLWDGELAAGGRTVVPTSGGLFALDNDDVTLVSVDDNTPRFRLGVRPVGLGRMLVVPWGSATSNTYNNLEVYGGSLTEQSPIVPTAGQTITVTQGSTQVTGSGSNFDGGKANKGAVIRFDSSVGNGKIGVVDSVQSATQLTLSEPWPYAGGTSIAGDYRIAHATAFQATFLSSDIPTFAAQVARRLILAQGSAVFFSTFNFDTTTGISYPAPFTFNSGEDRHQLPEGSGITGVASLRDALLVFTSAGVWAIFGLALEMTDSAGNPQQRLEQITRDVILWGDSGVATHGASLVVPALDDLYVMDAVSQPQPITGGARGLYRSYAKAGYRLGLAGVHRGHYMLPVLDASENMVDMLVWRLDAKGIPFVRFDGYGGLSRALVQRSRSGLAPQLLAVSGATAGLRVTDLSGVLDPSSGGSSGDADGSTYDLKVTTRTVTGPGLISHMWRRFRARLEGASSTPSVSLEYATGRPGASFTSVGSPQVRSVDNEQIYSWHFNESTRAIRFRLKVHSGGSREVLRSTSAGLRVSGKHRP